MVNECDFLVWLDPGCYRSGSILRKSLLHPEVGDVSTTDEQEMNNSPGSFTSSIVVPLAYLVARVFFRDFSDSKPRLWGACSYFGCLRRQHAKGQNLLCFATLHAQLYSLTKVSSLKKGKWCTGANAEPIYPLKSQTSKKQ